MKKVVRRLLEAFGKIIDNIGNRMDVTLLTKLKVYKALVIPSLLYKVKPSLSAVNGESCCQPLSTQSHLTICYALSLWQGYLGGGDWLLASRDHQHRGRIKVRDTKELAKADLPSINSIMKSQLHWVGHVVCTSEPPQQLLYWALERQETTEPGEGASKIVHHIWRPSAWTATPGMRLPCEDPCDAP